MVHNYKSTACIHSMHDRCRLYCKWCNNFCKCDCHDETKLTGHDDHG